MLSRQTSGGRFVPEVDGLRAIAIGAVLLFHVGGYALDRAIAAAPDAAAAGSEVAWLRVLTAPGYVGVQIFFAISGLILGLPFARAALAPDQGGAPVSIRAYFLRRLTRLEPPYVLCLLLWTGVLVVAKGAAFGELLPHLAASITYLHGAIYGEPSVINGVAWSLEVEVQFYLLAPILALVFRLRSMAARWVILLAGIVGSAALQPALDHPSVHNPLMGLTIAHHLHWFLVGFLGAELLATRWAPGAAPPSRATSAALDLAALIGLCLLWWLLQPERAHNGLAQCVGPAVVFLLIAAAFRGVLWRAVLTRPPVYLVGGMCYTIYLYHSLVKSAAGAVVGELAAGSGIERSPVVFTIVQMTAIGAAILVVSAVLFVLFERPFMRPLVRTIGSRAKRAEPR